MKSICTSRVRPTCVPRSSAMRRFNRRELGAEIVWVWGGEEQLKIRLDEFFSSQTRVGRVQNKRRRPKVNNETLTSGRKCLAGTPELS